MCAIAALIDEAMALAQEEGQALSDQDVDRAEDLSLKRAKLVRKIMERAAATAEPGQDGEFDLRAALLRMRTVQEELLDKAEKLRDDLLRQRQTGRKVTVYFDGDRRLSQENKRALYCDALS
ncbi:MAG: hypothetical protein LBN33_00155 [Desulfovibrio sp.]|nr:hypothetical protein [Desulfovibrio sp.]